MRIEIHPGEGGADAEMFAAELAEAMHRGLGTQTTTAGRVVSVTGPDHL